ncbi:DUF3152 domain-containing protein [Blastococcus deserti]|uniref:DUF3152 domain-containing protein n=1 Tax=Blastococcus deserti TaxID=2259033 RepID=A0ABW4X4X5_9ACTN
MGGRPSDGRPSGGRPDGARRVRPRAASVATGRDAVSSLHGGSVATARRPAPLVARPEPAVPSRARPVVRPRPGRLRRFVLRYGWRAYAVPLLTIATIVTLVDLAVSSPGAPAADAAAATTDSAPASGPVPPPAVEPTPTAPAEGDAAPTGAPQTVGVESYVERGAGTLSVVDGASPVYGAGPLQRFIVEVEDGIGVDGLPFAQAVEATLGDPRSWGSGGRMSFQRVGAAEAAAGQFDFKVSLVSPGSMETYCPGVGTGGYTSCRYGDRAVINLARWATAVPDYEGDVATYRLYVVNHEVGHALGNGHQDCPGPGQPAPVMQQQTLGLDGCVKNAWPYP